MLKPDCSVCVKNVTIQRENFVKKVIRNLHIVPRATKKYDFLSEIQEQNDLLCKNVRANSHAWASLS